MKEPFVGRAFQRPAVRSERILPPAEPGKRYRAVVMSHGVCRLTGDDLIEGVQSRFGSIELVKHGDTEHRCGLVVRHQPEELINRAKRLLMPVQLDEFDGPLVVRVSSPRRQGGYPLEGGQRFFVPAQLRKLGPAQVMCGRVVGHQLEHSVDLRQRSGRVTLPRQLNRLLIVVRHPAIAHARWIPSAVLYLRR
jgi:hypothetical protein